MSIENVRNQVVKFVNTNVPSTICINGKWGAGKTFMWNETIKSELEKEGFEGFKLYSYVSLFGLNSLSNLKFSIFECSKDFNTSSKDEGLKENLTSQYKTLKNKLKNLSQWLGAKDIAMNMGIDVSAIAFSSLNNCLICIDDFERRGEGLSAQDVLGLISYLREAKNCSVAIILNEQELGEEKGVFDRYLEKVIDLKLAYDPNFEDIAKICLREDDDKTVALKDCCKKLNMTNIRTIKKIKRLIADAFDNLDNKAPGELQQQIIHTLTILGQAYFEDQTFYKFIIRDYRVRALGDSVKLTTEQIRYRTRLNKYGFTYIEELNQCLMNGIEKGYFEGEKLNLELDKLHESIKKQKARREYEESWAPYHNTFDDNIKEIIDSVYSSFKKNIDYLYIPDVNYAVRFFKKFEDEERASELINLFVNHKDRGQKFWDARQYSTLKKWDPELLAILNKKFGTEKEVLPPREILLSIARGDRWSMEDTEYLASLSDEEYVEMIKNENSEELYEIVKTGLSFGNSSDNHRQVSIKMVKALKKIAKGSKLNEDRMKKYNIPEIDC